MSYALIPSLSWKLLEQIFRTRRPHTLFSPLKPRLRVEGLESRLCPSSVDVPGSSDPWLAGMPDGSTASLKDVAPDQSPVLVPDLVLNPGTLLTFTASGLVSNGTCGDPYCPTYGPEGGPYFGDPAIRHTTGAENGLADVWAPISSLVGIFLGPDQPDQSPPPDALDFRTQDSRDYLFLAPEIQQVFFIGDGLTSTGDLQYVFVPEGATRLFVGTMDGYGWYNNPGSFTVEVTEFGGGGSPSGGKANSWRELVFALPDANVAAPGSLVGSQCRALASVPLPEPVTSLTPLPVPVGGRSAPAQPSANTTAHDFIELSPEWLGLFVLSF